MDVASLASHWAHCHADVIYLLPYDPFIGKKAKTLQRILLGGKFFDHILMNAGYVLRNVASPGFALWLGVVNGQVWANMDSRCGSHMVTRFR